MITTLYPARFGRCEEGHLIQYCTCKAVEHDNEAKHALHILIDGEWTEAYHDELDEQWAQWKRIDDGYRLGGL